MSPRRNKGGRKAARPSETNRQSYLVPALVLVAVVGALVAIGVSRQTPDLPPEEAVAEPSGETSSDPELDRSRQEAIVILQRVVDRWTRNESEPWLLMHGLLAWGPRHLTRGGESVGVYLLDHHVETQTVAGREVRVFPMDDPSGSRIDAHADQTIKTQIEMGIPDARLDELVADAMWRFDYLPDQEGGPFPDANEVPWSAQAFCQSAEEGTDTFVNHAGTVVNLNEMTEALVVALETESEFLDEIRLRGETTYEKRRQGIFRYTCGGTHLYMAADACVAAGFGNPELSRRLVHQMDLLFWRMRREIEAVDQALTQAPQMAPLLVEQRLKYLGHFLETAAKAELHGTYSPTDIHRQELQYAERVLYLTVVQLQDMGVFDRLDTFHDEHYEYYLFTAGDACHALHALNLQDQLSAQRRGTDYVLPRPVYGEQGASTQGGAKTPPGDSP